MGKKLRTVPVAIALFVIGASPSAAFATPKVGTTANGQQPTQATYSIQSTYWVLRYNPTGQIVTKYKVYADLQDYKRNNTGCSEAWAKLPSLPRYYSPIALGGC